MLVSDQHYVRGEVAVFEAVNGWPRWVGAPLEVVMQLGTLAAAIVVDRGRRRPPPSPADPVAVLAVAIAARRGVAARRRA